MGAFFILKGDNIMLVVSIICAAMDFYGIRNCLVEMGETKTITNKYELKIKELEDKVVDLQDFIQPPPLTEEDKKRILAEFYGEDYE